MGKFSTVLVAIWIATLFAMPARSQVVKEFAPFVYDPARPDVLVLEGAIDGRTPLQFRRAMQRFGDVTTLSLNSGGGSVYAALPLAYEVHDARLRTIIPEGAGCASACSFLFFAGVERSAIGRLGVHQIAMGSNDLATGQVALGDIFASFDDFGVPTTVIARMMNTPAESMYWFEPAEMASLGLIGVAVAAPAAAFSGAVDEVPNMIAADMTLEFPGGDAVRFASHFRSAAWAGDASPDCDGDLQQLDDGGAMCTMVVDGTMAELQQEGSEMSQAGLTFEALASGTYQLTWDLQTLFTSQLGSTADMPPRNVLEALMKDDAWAFHIVGDQVLQTNGTLSPDKKTASVSVLMTDIFTQPEEIPKTLTALVRVANAPALPQAAPAAPAAPAPPAETAPVANAPRVATVPPVTTERPETLQTVLSVRPSGGDYGDIAAAVAAAPDGARIDVYPGTYRQGARVEKPLEIVGVGARESIVWEVTGSDVVEWHAPGGRISGMTLRQKGTSENDAWSAVAFGSGTTVLENCDLTAEDAAVVMIYGNETAPTVRGNAIHSGAESGIYFYDGAGGIVEKNEVYGNAYSGVAIKSGADPIVRDNQLRDGVQTGVRIYEDGRGRIENNEIYGNGYRGVEIDTGGDPVVVNNQIHDNGQSGVWIYDNALGTLEGNTIYANALAGVEIKSGANPTLRGNTIRDGQQGGILVLEEGRGVIEDNDIHDNAVPGIEVRVSGNPVVRGNRVFANGEAGIFIRENGLGTFEGNDIYDNVLAGIEITSGADPEVRSNTIRDGREGGFLIHGDGRGTIEDNDIYGNAKPGLEIKTGADPVVHGNRVYENGQSGIFIWDNGNGTVTGNEIYGNTLAGIEIANGADPKVRGNSIHDGKEGGMLIRDNGRGLVEDNDIFANAFAGINIGTGADPVVRNNKVRNGASGGIYVYENGRGTIERNQIYANGYSGVEIGGGANPVIRDNDIYDGVQSGIFVNSEGRGQITGNRIRNNTFGGIEVTGAGAPVARDNTITGNRSGIRLYDGGQGEYVGNDLRGNREGALTLDNAGQYTARDNQS